MANASLELYVTPVSPLSVCTRDVASISHVRYFFPLFFFEEIVLLPLFFPLTCLSLGSARYTCETK